LALVSRTVNQSIFEFDEDRCKKRFLHFRSQCDLRFALPDYCCPALCFY